MKRRLQFFADAWGAFLGVFKRFPLAMFSAATFVVFAGYFRDNVAWLTTSGIGIPLFTLSTLIKESLTPTDRIGTQAPSIIAALLLAVYGFSVHFNFGEELYDTLFLRLGMILLIIHLAIAFIPPLIARLEASSIWEYNKLLLSRFLISSFYSAVSFIGTALAITSVRLLFDIRIDEDNYFRLWLFFGFFFNTALILGGAPRFANLSDVSITVPAWIQFLCKFILLPLVVLYFAILYAYLGKIGLSLSWPNGMVGYPIFILAAIGGLTALLMWPIGNLESGAVWARSFWRWFFPLVVPLSIILILAMLKRINQYGYTELRYAGLIIASWLAGISAFYTLRRQADFRPIPISLCLVTLVFLIGPLSPRAISQKSQWNRLEGQLLEYGWLEENKLVNLPQSIEPEAYNQLRSTIRYLRSYYGPSRFRQWSKQLPDKYNDNLAALNKNTLPPYQLDIAIVEFLGATQDLSSQDNRYFNFNRNQESPYEFNGATRFYTYQFLGYAKQTGLKIDFDGQAVHLALVDGGSFLATKTEDGQTIEQIDFNDWMNANDFEARPHSPNRHLNLDSKELSFRLGLGSSRGDLHIVINNAHFTRSENRWSLNHGNLLVFSP